MESACAPSAQRANVELVRWPDDRERRSACAEREVPCLLVLDRTAAVPPLRPSEDWVYIDADERDVAARLERLGAEPVRAGSRLTAVADVVRLPPGLSAAEHRVAARLLSSPGVLVPRSHLPVDDLEDTIDTVGRALAADGWVIVVVGGSGYVLSRRSDRSP